MYRFIFSETVWATALSWFSWLVTGTSFTVPAWTQEEEPSTENQTSDRTAQIPREIDQKQQLISTIDAEIKARNTQILQEQQNQETLNLQQDMIIEQVLISLRQSIQEQENLVNQRRFQVELTIAPDTSEIIETQINELQLAENQLQQLKDEYLTLLGSQLFNAENQYEQRNAQFEQQQNEIVALEAMRSQAAIDLRRLTNELSEVRAQDPSAE